MGKSKRRESNGLDDVLPEDIGRKLVTSILEKESVKRLKTLVRGYSKQAIASYQEVDSTLSLLQFACLIGNIQAAEYLLGAGADRDICWKFYYERAAGWRTPNLRWLPVSVRTWFYMKAGNICFPGKPEMPMQPMHGAQLTILHMAALTNQQQMVRFLVEKKYLPVDARAGGTGVTPLLAVSTRRCCFLNDYSQGGLAHTCGHPDETHPHQPGSAEACAPLLGMFDLLIELGADPAAVDDCGCGVLAAAAAAGGHGLWDFLAREERLLWFDMRAVHASHVLLRAVQYCTSGEPTFLDKVVTYLRQLYTAHGIMPALVQQLKEPAPVFVDGADYERSVQLSHPLRAAMESPGGALEVGKLLELGVSLGALRAGLEELPVERPCPVENAGQAVLDELERGKPLNRHGRVLMALFYNCCMYKYPAGNAEVFKGYGLLVNKMSSGGIDFRERCWWPALPEAVMGPGCEALNSSSCILSSPLAFAASWNCFPAVAALLSLLESLGDRDFINECGPDGQTPLIAAAACGHLEMCKMLINAGADICKTGWDGNWPLFAAACLDSSLDSRLILSCLIDKLLKLMEHRPAKVWDLLHQPGPGRMTLIQRLLHSRQDDFVCSLAPKMEPLFVYMPPTPLRTVCLRPEAEANKELLLSKLLSSTGQSVTDALTEHDTEHGLTVLGQAVAWGHVKTVQILASTCKQQGLKLAPLLERHVDRSPFSTPLFNAIIHQYPDILRSLAVHTLSLTPEIYAQHLLLSPEALQDGGRLAGRVFVRSPQPGETESISMLMCAASAGNVGALKMMLKSGVKAREEPFPGNRWYRNALTAAIDFPELSGFPGGEELHDGSTSNMGTTQLACVQELLKAGGAMTEKQVYRVLDTIYHVSDTQIGAELFGLMRKLALCHHCKVVGRWRKCSGGCCSTFYCSVDCQAAEWPQHREHCMPVKPVLDSTPGIKAVTEMAATFTKVQLGV
ncbi:hypothetical protein COCOBI_06-0940 [Coccomyxa sp. Obi]|nr:hypothetical protein COCOBI_06-0940 [Coccomyxa sp. Obi]